MRTFTHMKLLPLLVSAVLFTGCASSASREGEVDVESASEDLTTQEQLQPFRDALRGISSRGSEGDPVPYRAIMVTLKEGDTWDADTLAARIGPRISRIRERDAIYGHQQFATGYAMRAFWEQETTPRDPADPNEVARASRMAALRTLCASKLTRVTHLVVGRRSNPAEPSSIETGAVAPLIVGKLRNGKLVVMYGIDIWT